MLTYHHSSVRFSDIHLRQIYKRYIPLPSITNISLKIICINCFYPDQQFIITIYIDIWLTRPYSIKQMGVSMLQLVWLTITQYVFQRPLWHDKVRLELIARKIVSCEQDQKLLWCLPQVGFKKLLWFKLFNENIVRALECHVCKNSQNGWPKKRRPTGDCDMSNSMIYQTPICREYTVLTYYQLQPCLSVLPSVHLSVCLSIWQAWSGMEKVPNCFSRSPVKCRR